MTVGTMCDRSCTLHELMGSTIYDTEKAVAEEEMSLLPLSEAARRVVRD